MNYLTPKFSVIIPLYNKGKYIERTIKSVLNQSFSDYELLVVDDGSTDNSLEVVKQFNSIKIKLFQKANGGESSARNFGIEAANGEFLCFLDADDEYLKTHLETLYELINEYSNERFFATNYYNNSPNMVKPELAFDNITESRIIDDYFHESVKMGLVTSNTACIKSIVFDDVGIFDENLKYGPDLEMWFRIALKNDLVFSSIPTAIYNRDAENRVMHSMSKFNDTFIDKLFKDLNGEIKCTSERKYVEIKLIQECKRHLRLGNNRLVRSKIQIHKLVFCNYYHFIKWWIITFLPFSFLSPIRLKIKKMFN